MGAHARPAAYVRIEDYRALEDASRFKHEYLDGVIYQVQGDAALGMAGGSAAHADLIRNLGFALHTKLRDSPCSVKMSDMRLRIDAAAAVFYPDVLVHCQPLQDPVAEARLVAEVLSPATQNYDLGAKLAAYRLLPGLQHVVVVSSTEQAAWSCHRVPADAPWTPLAAWPRGSALSLDGIGVAVEWSEVYGGVGLT